MAPIGPDAGGNGSNRVAASAWPGPGGDRSIAPPLKEMAPVHLDLLLFQIQLIFPSVCIFSDLVLFMPPIVSMRNKNLKHVVVQIIYAHR